MVKDPTVKEVRRYSDKTITIAAKCIRRALRFIPGHELSVQVRVDRLIEYLVRNGFQPVDLARPTGAAALVAIASALPTTTHRHINIDSEGSPILNTPYVRTKPAIMIDSFTNDLATLQALHETKTTNRGLGWAGINYSALELQIAAQLALTTPVKLSKTWQRVIDRVMRMPGLT